MNKLKNININHNIHLCNENLEALNKSLEKSNSFWHVLLLGIIKGVGTAIGATIIFAIVIFILSKTIKTIELIPSVDRFIQETNIDQIINSSDIKK